MCYIDLDDFQQGIINVVNDIHRKTTSNATRRIEKRAP